MIARFFTALFLILVAARSNAADLESNFASPPPEYRPWVYWFAVDGNQSEKGITADLEAMSKVDIGGALYFEVSQGVPKGPIDFESPEWFHLIGHALNEAKRVGLKININNGAGWAGSGGPWITPELSMLKVVRSETFADGGVDFKAVLQQPASVNGFYKDIAVLAMPAPASDKRIEDIANLAEYLPGSDLLHWSEPASFPQASSDSVIVKSSVIDLTDKMDTDGTLTWSPPPGKWLIIRFGYTTTGHQNSPAPDSGRGLECDKLSKKAITVQYNNLISKLVTANKGLAGQGNTLVSTHIDSWELGSQNWTPLMREEFKKRRGYDMLSFLPVFSGRIIESTEVTQRFLWDLRQTISEMIAENYAAELRRLANKDGLRLSIEAYDGVPADELAYGGEADEPMAEFWAWDKFTWDISCTEMASVGHTYGRPVVAAESFTSQPSEKWQGYPGNLKDLADWAFCEGINRFVIHRFAEQPWTDKSPGMSMGPYGLHYERTQTWWNESKAWHDYLARCSYLLRQGLFNADVAYMELEGAPRRFEIPSGAELAPHIRSGYNYDACSTEVVMKRMTVKDGRIVLPDGMSYRVLVLPQSDTMTPALIKKIKELHDEGATIIADSKPPVRSPSLTDMGEGDDVVKQAAAELWPSLITGKTAAEVLSSKGIPPDFSSVPLLRSIHRTKGDSEIYFVANPNASPVDAVAKFRVLGKRPEFWWPDTGKIVKSVDYEEKDGVTSVPLQFGPSGSVFVVFQAASAGNDPIVSISKDGQVLAQSSASIIVQKATYGLPASPNQSRDVTSAVQKIVDKGTFIVPVSSMADGGDPAPGVIKTLTISYSAQGNARTASGIDGGVATLNTTADSNSSPIDIMSGEIFESGNYSFDTASGKSLKMNVNVPEPQEISGPWQVNFDPKWGGPAKISFDKLVDWSHRSEDGIKYYSGTATYQNTFDFQASRDGSKHYLDLGKVDVMAHVWLNDHDLGTLWKAPYRVDITDFLRTGKNSLRISVCNLWINRMIGDEQLPEDSDRVPEGALRSWPDWVLKDQPSPTGRFTFTTWKLWKKNDALVESGLIGPVAIVSAVDFDSSVNGR